MANSFEDIQRQRGYYLDRMASADQLLSLWYRVRLKVPPEEEETFTASFRRAAWATE